MKIPVEIVLLWSFLLATWTPKTQAFISCTSKPTQSSDLNNFSEYNNSNVTHIFVILGASGDLAKRKIYPALWTLYKKGLLPARPRFLGYAPSNITVAELRERVVPFVRVSEVEEKLYDEFWRLNEYVGGSKNADADYEEINRLVEGYEGDDGGNRIFYMALPPAVFPSAASQIKRACMAKKGSTRVVIEKPFGRDSESSSQLSDHLSALFSEDQIYRMDHYLGKEMVQNIVALRFGNRVFQPAWSKDDIAAVEILFEEKLSVEGRGGYFDSYGIIRDVMQNHLLQVFSLLAMETPRSGRSNDLRDTKVQLLKKTRNIVLDDVVLGQYVENPNSTDLNERVSYVDDPTVPNDSLTPTFAVVVLKVDNPRWRGVPFIIRAGKGLGEERTEVRIQFRNISNKIFSDEPKRNELVLNLKDEAIQLHLMSKTPGFSSNIEQIKLDFTYENQYKNLEVPGAYERLILAVFQGNQINFVRTDELKEAWRIFTPVLHEIEKKKVRPMNYVFGSRGPFKADEIEKKYNFL